MDLNLVALVGLSCEMDELKRKTVYSILSDFPVFDDQKDFSTIIIKSPQSAESDEEEEAKEDKELSPMQQELITQCKRCKHSIPLAPYRL